MRAAVVLLSTLVLAPLVAQAQVEELVSPYVQVFAPHGDFVRTLIRVKPAGGDGWKMVGDPKLGCRLAAPQAAAVDATPSGSRILQVVLSNSPTRPRPILRVDQFKPDPGEPTAVDSQYAADYAEQYGERAFAGRFTVSDSGHIVLRKRVNLAMVGGVYKQGAASAYRLQAAHLSADRQLFFTFDCAEKDRELYQETVAQMLLSLEVALKEK